MESILQNSSGGRESFELPNSSQKNRKDLESFNKGEWANIPPEVCAKL